jgi:hypothetical protein
MDIDGSKTGQGHSVFRRPPPPRTSAPGASRPVATSVPLAIGEPMSVATNLKPTADAELVIQCRRSAQWFYWIAGLSLINAVLGLAGQNWRFIIGLGVTQLFEELAPAAGTVAHIVALAVIGFFGMLGQRALAGRSWAFLTGMILYGLDGLIFLLIQDWIGVGFHAFAIFMMSRGYMASRQLAA